MKVIEKSDQIELDSGGSVSARFIIPETHHALYVFAHGAGAGMNHAFMEASAERLADRGIATMRYQFPYTEAGKKRPDRPALLEETSRTAIRHAHRSHPDLPLFAGGKSMGGRITSQVAAKESLPGLSGIVFYGFPLHAPGKSATKRAEHLHEVPVPMLFLQGTRDKLAELELITGVCEGLSGATLHIADGGDHSFHVLKRSGRTDEEVLDELAETAAAWMLAHSGPDAGA